MATFYGALLGRDVKASDDWAEVRDDGQRICFQPVADYAAPKWPGQQAPQQMHLDVMVDGLDEGEAAVLQLGATKHEHQPGT
ncbi:MAG: VOC family protein [Humibacillus sp.]|nr:VOC family protein [Humibacillus sp.]MDN5775832.1 VOC family protein [Humibacillus sp.]